ncbi:hypothetical protein FRB94_000318 [Tulasnella sp. JGI-2019a]|nr:hypothetical protein FRB93_010223 [Tulasnella sp. JGI-2019a]KAG8988935.1 hypothetical protein FRB94_000318 [Tulasnella sp. JGI-2019a]KAG9023296.1 hypothetical protein FRB95_013276 [Tulasnella sp. JGI-2019a]
MRFYPSLVVAFYISFQGASMVNAWPTPDSSASVVVKRDCNTGNTDYSSRDRYYKRGQHGGGPNQGSAKTSGGDPCATATPAGGDQTMGAEKIPPARAYKA